MYFQDVFLQVIDVKQIESVVAMIPDFHIIDDRKIEMLENQFFLVEKISLDIITLSSEKEEDENAENDESDIFAE